MPGQLEKRVTTLEKHHADLQERIDENIRQTKALRENTDKIVELIESWNGAMHTLEAIARFFKPVGYIAAAITALIALTVSIKEGVWPK